MPKSRRRFKPSSGLSGDAEASSDCPTEGRSGELEEMVGNLAYAPKGNRTEAPIDGESIFDVEGEEVLVAVTAEVVAAQELVAAEHGELVVGNVAALGFAVEVNP